MIVRVGNNIELTFNGIKKTVLFFEFSFKEVGENVILYQNDKILFNVPKSEVDIKSLADINLITGEDGKKGNDGKDGRDGNNGLNGTSGKDGINGIDGKDGINGTNGYNGADGKDGKDAETFTPSKEFILNLKGKDGKDGLNGSNGLNGIDGTNGTNGENGSNGTNGSKGTNGVSFIWSGVYELGEDYSQNEVVEFENSSFICVVATNESPIKDNKINTDFWDLLALRGLNGKQGGQGVKGDKGDKGDAGGGGSGIGSYFSLDATAKLTPNPFIEGIRVGNLFTLDTDNGDLTPNASGVDDNFFELVGGELTPKIL